MSDRQFRLFADLAIIGTVIVIALIVLSPSGSFLAGGERGQHLSQQQTWVVHAVLFAGLGIVIGVRIAAAGRSVLVIAALVVALLLLTVLGALAEAAQLQVDSRSASYGDWVSDTIGAAAGLWIGAVIARPLMLLITRR